MRGSAPQSDVALRILPEYGGQSHEEKASRQARLNWLEVAGSSAPLDLGRKRNLYASAGVREYIVVLIEEGRVLWLWLEGGVYGEIAPTRTAFCAHRSSPVCGSIRRPCSTRMPGG